MTKLKMLSLLLVLFTSCKLTQQKAKRQLVKIESAYTHLFANPCARLYPIREIKEIEKEYIKGETKYSVDTQYVDCEKQENKGKSIAVPCKSTHTTDTFKVVEKSIQENTAKLDVCMQSLEAEKHKCKDLEIAFEKKITKLEADKEALQNQLKKYKKIERVIKLTIGILGVAILVFCAIKFSWFGKIIKLIKNIF